MALSWTERKSATSALMGWGILVAAGFLWQSLGGGDDPVGAEATRLRHEILELEERLQVLRAQEALIEQVGRIESALTPIPGRLLAVDLDPRRRGAVLNLGSADGVRVGQGVVGPRGVVGRITQVRDGHSWVMLADDVDFRVLIDTAAGEQVALAAGGQGARKLRTILHREAVHYDEGDSIVTAGGDGVFPRGILVGKVEHMEPEGQGARLELAVDPARVSAVAVLAYPPPPDDPGRG